jgi:hypothetical protein
MIEPAARENWNGEMVIFFENEDEYNKFIADTTQAMVLEVSDGTYSLTINMDKVLYEQVDIVKEDDFIAAKFSYQALFDTTNNRYGNAVLVSSESTI